MNDARGTSAVGSSDTSSEIASGSQIRIESVM